MNVNVSYRNVMIFQKAYVQDVNKKKRGFLLKVDVVHVAIIVIRTMKVQSVTVQSVLRDAKKVILARIAMYLAVCIV